MRASIEGVSRDDLRHMQGSHWLGWNANGVTHSTLTIDGDDVYTYEEMPGEFVQEIIDSVAAVSGQGKQKRPGGMLHSRIPLPLYMTWRKQWEAGPKQWGLLWHAYLSSKVEHPDYSKFRVRR